MKMNPTDNPIVINCKGADLLPLDRIVEFQGKLKRLTEANRNKLINSICSEGFIAPLFLWDDQGEYRAIDGHGRLKALIWMRQKGWDIPMLPVDYIEAKNEKDARGKLLKITSQYGEFDLDELNFWLDDLDDDISESIRLVNDEMDIAISPGMGETIGDDELPEYVEPITKLGDIWELGDNRLLCGDSTDVEIVKELMDGKLGDMYLTDPPYNVDYVGKTKDKLKIENDKMSDDDFREFLRSAFKAVDNVLKAGGVFYIWFADCETHNFTGALKDVGFQLRQMVIWKKNSMVMGRKDYHFIHEPCLYGWKSGAGHLWATDRKQTTILQFDRPSRSSEHPTMKPVDLMEYQILNNTKGQDIVIDSFIGSGSTLIAAEKTKRICYGMEIDPHYCDVTVNRYITWCSKNDRAPIVKLNGEEWNATR